MSPAQIVSLDTRRNSIQLRCTSCSATTQSTCDCGVPYEAMRPSAAAAKAVAASPGKSDRAIADEIGVSHVTVGKARKTGGKKVTTSAKRVGRDGKSYAQPKKQTRKPAAKKQAKPVAAPSGIPMNRQVNAMTSQLVDFVEDYAAEFMTWTAKVGPQLSVADKDSLTMFLHTSADKLLRLAQALDGR